MSRSLPRTADKASGQAVLLKYPPASNSHRVVSPSQKPSGPGLRWFRMVMGVAWFLRMRSALVDMPDEDNFDVLSKISSRSDD